ncbi:hypothetical protein B6N25_06300 [Sphingobacteriales bacterium TSM_CSS]|nr:hypothetical protein B6N25_06300 [Sphingobacteriales bacterium TSM_CSS]
MAPAYPCFTSFVKIPTSYYKKPTSYYFLLFRYCLFCTFEITYISNKYNQYHAYKLNKSCLDSLVQ